MTIRYSKEHGHFIAQCDECFDVVDLEDRDDRDEFEGAKADIDADGWRTIRGGLGKWRNICPDCL